MSKLKNFFLRPLELWESIASCISEMKSAIISFAECVSNYSKLVNLFGKRHSASEQLFKWLPKKARFLLPHHSYMKTWIKLEITYKPPKGSHLFDKGSFVTFGSANLEAIGNKHSVSDSVLKCHTTQCQSSHFFTNLLFSQRRRHESKKGKCNVTPL